MFAVQINDIKSFMKHFLVSDMFDEFELVHATISTYNVIDIDGKVNKDFFGEEYEETLCFNHEYTPWKHIKDFIFNIIKGKHTPLSFKFILHASDQITGEILTDMPAADDMADNIDAFVLTIRYDDHGLMLTSGTILKTFSLDKSADEAWDKWLSVFTQDMQ